MSIHIQEVNYLAKLARIRLSVDEAEDIALQLNTILEYMSKLEEVNTKEDIQDLDMDETGRRTTLRQDSSIQRITSSEALSCSNQQDDKYFRVPKVVK